MVRKCFTRTVCWGKFQPCLGEYGWPSNQGCVLIIFPNPPVYNTQVVFHSYRNSVVKTECTEECLRLSCLFILQIRVSHPFFFPYTREEQHSPVFSSLRKWFSTQGKGLQSAVWIKLLPCLRPHADNSLLWSALSFWTQQSSPGLASPRPLLNHRFHLWDWGWRTSLQ